MAELFAVSNADTLSQRESAAFASMWSELMDFRPGRTAYADLGFCRVGVISRHRLDHAIIKTLDDPPVTLAWVGTPPERKGFSFEDVARAVLTQRTERLGDLEPRFAALICDPASRSTWLLSDRHGLMPVYYARSSASLVCATKLLPLARSELVDQRIDLRAVSDFFAFEHAIGDCTLLEAVRVLPAASTLRSGSKLAGPTGYWTHPLHVTEDERQRKPTPGELYERLKEGVRAGIDSESRTAIMLSGGLDSRALLGALTDAGVTPSAHTFGVHGCRDILYAEKLARACRLQHRVVPIDFSFLPRWLEHSVYVGDGMVGAAHFHVLTLADSLVENADVVVDGLAGDSLTGGHLMWRMMLDNDVESMVGKLLAQRGTAFVSPEQRSRLFSPDFLGALDYDARDALRPHFEDLAPRTLWRGCHRFDLLERQRRFIQYGGQLLQPFVNVETPFYANAFFDTAMRLSPFQLLQQRTYLKMHQRYLRQLAVVPDSLRGIPLVYPHPVRFAKRVADFTVRRLPVPVRRRLKSPDSPTTDYPSWFAGPLAAFVEERIEQGIELANGLFQPQLRRREGGALKSLLATATASQIGCLLTFSAWQIMRRRKTPRLEPPWPSAGGGGDRGARPWTSRA